MPSRMLSLENSKERASQREGILHRLGESAHQRRECIVALAVFGVVTAYMLYPVSLHPATLINGRVFEDAFEYVWYLDWYERALFDLQVSPLFQPDIFYPTGWNLGFSAFPPLYPALLAPLTALVGAVAAYNLALMATCIIAAYGAYRLTRSIGAGQWGGIIAGLAFAFYPQREVYLGGHLNFLTGSMWMPWVLYGLIQANGSARRRLRWAAFSGMAVALTVAGSWHFVFIGSLAFATFGAAYLLPSLRREWRAWLKPLAASTLTALAIIAPFLVYAAFVNYTFYGGARFAFQGTSASGVSLERFVVPSAMNPLFWDLARTTFPLTRGINDVVTFGYTVLFLAILSLWWARPWNRPVKALLATTALGALLMPGLTLHLWGEPVALEIGRPGLIEAFFPQLIQPDGSVAIPMPALILYTLFPPFRTFHAYGRWGLMVTLGLAPLAGIGLTRLQNRLSSRRSKMAVGAVAIMLVLVEFNMQPLPVVTSISEMQRGVDSWLSDLPEETVIIEYPLDYTMKGQTLYYAAIHGQKIAHGAGSILPQQYAERLPLLKRWPAPATLDLLQEIGVQYVLVNVYSGDHTFEEQSLPRLRESDRLRLVRRFDDAVGPIRAIYLFELERGENQGQ